MADYSLAKTFDAYTDEAYIKKNITDLRFADRPLWESAEKGSLEVEGEGIGHKWRMRLAYGKTNNAKPIDDDTDLLTDKDGVPLRRKESGTYCYGEYVYYSNAIILGEITDVLEQSGNVQLEKLIDDEFFKVRDDLFNTMNEALYGTGVITATGTDLKTLTSFRDMLRAGVTSSHGPANTVMDTYEGIDRKGIFLATDRFPLATADYNQWWMPTVDTCTGTTDLIWELKSWIIKAKKRNKGKKFTVILCNEAMLKVLYLMQESKQAMLLPWNPQKDDIDWLAEFAISGIPLVQDEEIPDNEFWGLEYSTFGLKTIMPFKRDPWAKMQHYSQMFTVLKWGGQLVCNNPGGNGVFTYAAS
jgi:hypothetical protein